MVCSHSVRGFLLILTSAIVLLSPESSRALTGPVVYSEGFEVTPLSDWTLDPPGA